MNKFPNYLFIPFNIANSASYSPTYSPVNSRHSSRPSSPEVLEVEVVAVTNAETVSASDEPSTAPLPGEAGTSYTFRA